MKAFLTFLACAFASALFSQSNIQQSLSVNGTGAAADASAQLDVSANNKGVLVPRMTTGERVAIVSPATGLLVFDTTTGTFWFFNGSVWMNVAPQTLLTDADNDTKIQVEESPDEDIIRFDLGGTEGMSLRKNTGGFHRLELPNLGNNTFVGANVGSANTTGSGNTASGDEALSSNTTGDNNVATGYQALSSNTTGSDNTAIGRSALLFNTTGFDNTAIGNSALLFNATGVNNTANGTFALFSNTTGSDNTAIGRSALFSNSTGDDNTANGWSALSSNTTGDDNTANGWSALRSNTTGYVNTATGGSALFSNTTGDFNTANGWSALRSNTTGVNNTANGTSALYSNTTGDDNTAIGYEALEGNTNGYDNTAGGIRSLLLNTTGYRNTAYGRSTGSFNDNNIHCTFIGYDADQTVLTDFDNSTALGSFSRITASNQVRIGNSSVSSIGGYAPWTDVSDRRFKQNLQADVPGLGFILKLRPVTYNLDVHGLAAHLQEDRIENFEKEKGEAPQKPSALTLQSREAKSQIRCTGFVAQEVEEAAQSIGYDFSGVDKPQSEEGLYGLRYSEFVVPLVKAVQEQQKIIEAQSAENKALKTQVETLSAQLDKINAALAGAGISVEK